MNYTLVLRTIGGVVILALALASAETPQSEDLKQNMRERLRAVEEIIGSLGSSNFTEAQSIALNRLPIPQDLPLPEGTTVPAGEFHASVTRFINQLAQQNLQEAVNSLSQILQKCTACHEQTRR
jgi:hypothetical protein